MNVNHKDTMYALYIIHTVFFKNMCSNTMHNLVFVATLQFINSSVNAPKLMAES